MKFFGVIFFLLAVSGTTFAELNPEVELAAKVIASTNYDEADGESDVLLGDVSHSSLLIGFREKLYNDLIGQMVIGMESPHVQSGLEAVYFDHVFIGLDGEDSAFKIGRSSAHSSLIEFPTLRDDDAFYFSDAVSPLASGANTEESQLSGLVEYDRRIYGHLWVGVGLNQFDDPLAADPDRYQINGYTANLQYRLPMSLRWNRNIIEQVGVGTVGHKTDRANVSGDWNRTLKNYLASTILNVYPDPVYFVDFRMQGMINEGFSENTSIASHRQMAQAGSYAGLASMRFSYRRLESSLVGLAVTFGYKRFVGLTNPSQQLQSIAHLFYRMGESFDVGLQYMNFQNTGELRNIFSAQHHRAQFFMTFAIDQHFNRQFDDRDSLLNLEHGYIP